jgi:bifunctional UDP-N-acetylglucosamine pyrophosphorylase / glucosamine-1-phosphate N-acetyltransferase
MTDHAPHFLVLAAGRGKRMLSQLPKVLHTVLYRPMVHYVLDIAYALPHRSIGVIVGHGESQVRAACAGYAGLNYFVQSEQKGTAHAVQMAEEFLRRQKPSDTILVLSGDVMLLRRETIEHLLAAHRASAAACTVLTARLGEPYGYGRILRSRSGRVAAIREEVDCSAAERAVQEVNSGIYCFRLGALLENLGRVSDSNRQKELYLTDVVGLLRDVEGGVAAHLLDDPAEMTGVNDRLALAEVETILSSRTNRELMLRGVTMRQPATIAVDPRCRVEGDVVIEGGTTLINSRVAAGAVIESHCRIVDSEIGPGAHVKQGSYIEGSTLGPACAVGPYAHLRPGSRLEEKVKIGNFVELKKAHFGVGAKASHLSYIGDAEIGADVNLGCGFITCNYDGFRKHQTVIEEGVFVGSDSQVIAPVRIGRGAYVASGTTVTRDVPADALAIARPKQENKEGYAARLRSRFSRKREE